MKKLSFYFFKLDHIMSLKINELLNSSSLEGLDHQIKNLGSKNRSYLLNTISVLIILAPIIATLVVYSSNKTAHNSLNTYSEITTLVSEVISSKKEIKSKSRALISKQTVENEESLLELLNNIGTKFTLPDGRIEVEEFSINTNSNLKSSIAKVLIKKISLYELTRLLEEVVNRYNWAVSDIQIDRINDQELLVAKIVISVFNN